MEEWFKSILETIIYHNSAPSYKQAHTGLGQMRNTAFIFVFRVPNSPSFSANLLIYFLTLLIFSTHNILVEINEIFMHKSF